MATTSHPTMLQPGENRGQAGQSQRHHGHQARSPAWQPGLAICIVGAAHRASFRWLRPVIQRAAKFTRKVTTKSTRPVAISSDCRSGVDSL